MFVHMGGPTFAVSVCGSCISWSAFLFMSSRWLTNDGSWDAAMTSVRKKSEESSKEVGRASEKRLSESERKKAKERERKKRETQRKQKETSAVTSEGDSTG